MYYFGRSSFVVPIPGSDTTDSSVGVLSFSTISPSRLVTLLSNSLTFMCAVLRASVYSMLSISRNSGVEGSDWPGVKKIQFIKANKGMLDSEQNSS